MSILAKYWWGWVRHMSRPGLRAGRGALMSNFNDDDVLKTILERDALRLDLEAERYAHGETRAELEPFKDVANRLDIDWLGEEEACDQMRHLLKRSPGPYALEISRLQDVVLKFHAERQEYVVKLDALREEIDAERARTSCTPAERKVLEAIGAISHNDMAAYAACHSPWFLTAQAELARRGESSE